MFKKMFLGIMFLMSVSGIVLAAEKQSIDDKTVSLEAAQKWLGLVDQGKYDQTWSPAAEYFKALVSQSQWQMQIQAVRQSLGNLLVRNLKTQDHKTSLPGVPDGEYYIFTFDSSFTSKKEAVETVTVMKDQDGQWRLAGYFIK